MSGGVAVVRSNCSECQAVLAPRFYDGCAAGRSLAPRVSCYEDAFTTAGLKPRFGRRARDRGGAVQRQEFAFVGIVGLDCTGFDVVHPTMNKQMPVGHA